MEKEFKKSPMKDLLNNEEIFADLQMNNFLDRYMIKVIEHRETMFEEVFYKEVIRMGVTVDKERLLKWLKKCDVLDKIEESDLINFATKKRINNLINKNYSLKREIERHKEFVKHWLKR